MRLNQKIAKLYMQKQAGNGSLLAFPSVMFALKELSNQAKDHVSDVIVESLSNIYHNIMQSAQDIKYDLEVVKKKELENDIVLIGEGKYWRDTGWEQDTMNGPAGLSLTLNMSVDLQEVAQELAKDLNAEAKQFLSGKIQPAGILKSLKEGSYLNAIGMFIKQEIKKADIVITAKDIEVFLDDNRMWEDYVGLNGLIDGEQYLLEDETGVIIKDVNWSGNKLNFLFDLEVLYHVSGHREYDPIY